MPNRYPCEKFANVSLTVESTNLPTKDKAAVSELIKAAKLLEDVYLRQVSPLNFQYKQEIEDTGKQKLIQSFRIMAGPWDRLNEDAPFYGHNEKPRGAGFYPADLTPERFREWLQKHPEDRSAFESYTTLIEATDEGLKALPYSKAFSRELEKCAQHLQNAAQLCTNESLSRFLKQRAQSLLDNDYAKSEVAWLEVTDSEIEVVFGPYEVYEDKLLGLKACFECYIGLRDAMQTRALRRFADFVPQMQAALPIDEELKPTELEQGESRFVVIDLLFASGEAAHGPQTLALVLPNDPEVIQNHGSKKVLFRNVQHAKFDKILIPIAAEFMNKEQLTLVNFDAFFRHTLLHETGHSLGPKHTRHTPTLAIHRALNTAYSPIEEAKADTLALYLTHWLVEQNELPADAVPSAYATMLAGFFRALRFGLGSAHAKANAIQLNYYIEFGAITHDDALVFSYDAQKLPEANRQLVAKLIELEAEGDEEVALAFVQKYAQIRPEIAEKLQSLTAIPVDIAPNYPNAEEFLAYAE
ncbi:MAG: hypothetical protein WC966_08825 [Bradymonadales bacterium]|jgi:hypothetical protein